VPPAQAGREFGVGEPAFVKVAANATGVEIVTEEGEQIRAVSIVGVVRSG
jgi:hypothetical protein